MKTPRMILIGALLGLGFLCSAEPTATLPHGNPVISEATQKMIHDQWQNSGSQATTASANLQIQATAPSPINSAIGALNGCLSDAVAAQKATSQAPLNPDQLLSQCSDQQQQLRAQVPENLYTAIMNRLRGALAGNGDKAVALLRH